MNLHLLLNDLVTDPIQIVLYEVADYLPWILIGGCVVTVVAAAIIILIVIKKKRK